MATASVVALVLTTLAHADAFSDETGESTTPLSLSELLAPPETDAPTAVELLDPEHAPAEGVSLGTTSSGRIHDGVALPVDGEHVAVLPTHLERDSHYAARNLRDLIVESARELRTSHGDETPRVMIGDASSQHGGDLRGHRSHNCGRDIDVVFMLRDAAGEPVEATTFNAFDDDLTPRHGAKDVAFDVAANWALVASWLEHPDVEVQYIFVYDPIRRALLEHAEEIGADEDLVARAEHLLHQPSDSTAHSDHFHLRVYCSARDRLEGCQNWGPNWPWAETHDDVVSHVATGLARAAERSDDTVALERIESARAHRAAEEVVGLLDHPDERVRERALETLQTIGVPPAALPSLPTAYWTVAAEDRAAVVGLMGRTGHPSALPFLASLVQRADTEIAMAAMRSLVRIDHPDAVAPLVTLLEHDEPDVRSLALDALRRITNQPGAPDGEAQAQWWGDWVEEHGDGHQRDWWLQGFADAGLELGELHDPDAVTALIDIQLEAPRWLADNAHRTLMRTVDHYFSTSTPPEKRVRRWRRWWARNAWRWEDEPQVAAQ